jgi:hypothetical protein
MQEWNTDEDKFGVISMYLKPSVRAWFYEDDFETWMEFKDAFIARYGKNDHGYTPLKKLLAIKRKDVESIREYSDRFRRLKNKQSQSSSKEDGLSMLSEKDLVNICVTGRSSSEDLA